MYIGCSVSIINNNLQIYICSLCRIRAFVAVQTFLNNNLHHMLKTQCSQWGWGKDQNGQYSVMWNVLNPQSQFSSNSWHLADLHVEVGIFYEFIIQRNPPPPPLPKKKVLGLHSVFAQNSFQTIGLLSKTQHVHIILLEEGGRGEERLFLYGNLHYKNDIY